MKTTNLNPAQNDDITPEPLFANRRKFLRLSALFGTAFALAACGVKPTEVAPTPMPTPTEENLANELTSEESINNFNNFYEFTVSKSDVAKQAANLKTSPWPIEIGGLVDNPMTIDAADLIARYPAEERIYRLRCVETWSMVIPWYGFPLHKLLKDLAPQPEAKYIKFTTLLDPEQMPGQQSSSYLWPYTEGLRLDEAMHDLTLLAWGVYQKPLTPQTGAPIRLVVPWKYGFKSIKSIVKMELTAEQPETYWNKINPREYGFYANVNPGVPHPRWSQSSEVRAGESGHRETLLFNGYEAEVASLYAGMDLKVNY